MRIPLVVIGGFLGSGKTTLLNHWLTHAGGRRLAVLVNDFGALNIDAGLVAAHGGDSIALTSGCVCCAIGDDLVQALGRVLEQNPPFDGIVIEASGVADPWRIAQVALVDPALALEGIVVLVDASSFDRLLQDPLLADSLTRQLARADLVVLNQTDRASADAWARSRQQVQRIAPHAPCVETQQAQVDPATLLLPRAATTNRHLPPDVPSPDPNHAAQYSTWAAQPRVELEVNALRAGIAALAPQLLRLKGWVRTDRHGWTEIQLAGRHVDLRPARVPPAQAAVVAIGLSGRLPHAALQALFGLDTTVSGRSGPWVLAPEGMT